MRCFTASRSSGTRGAVSRDRFVYGSVMQPRRRLKTFGLGCLLCLAHTASGQPIVGYQLGLTESLSATYGDDLNTVTAAIEAADEAAADRPGGATTAVSAVDARALARELRGMQGLVSDTTASASLTLDLPGRVYDQGFLLSAAISQIIPSLVPDLPEDLALPTEAQYTLRENTTTGRAGIEYIGLLRMGQGSLRMRLGYQLLANGRLEAGPNGGYAGNAAVTAAYPTASAGIFGFNAVTHQAGASLDHQLNYRVWGLRTILGYDYTKNGVYNLAAGAIDAGGTSDIGAFVQADVHTFNASAELRLTLSRRDQLFVLWSHTLTLPEQVDDELIVTGTDTVVVPAAAAIPKTWLQRGQLRWEHQLRAERWAGLSFTADYNERVPSDTLGNSQPGGVLEADTLIISPRATYRDHLLRWELRINASAGAAQAYLLQPPIGAEVDQDSFETIHSDWQPVFNLTLNRRFAPVDVQLMVERNVGVGAFGASAVITDAAELTARYQLPISRIVFTAGANINRTQGVDKDKFRASNAQDALQMTAFNNWGAGAQLGVMLPIYRAGQLSVDLQAGYLYSWANTDPDHLLNIPSTDTHTGVVALRMLWGRGTAQRAAQAGGQGADAEAGAYGADPRTGAPLLSSQFYTPDPQLGAPTPVNERANPNASPRDYRQAQAAEAAAQPVGNGASGQVQAVASSEEEARRAEARRREEERRRIEDEALRPPEPEPEVPTEEEPTPNAAE